MPVLRMRGRWIAVSEVAGTPLEGVDLLLADLDGVIYRGANAIPHAVEGITRASRNCRVGYVTNNSSRTAAAVAKQLRGFGLDAVAEDIITSPQAAVRLLAGLVPSGSTVLAIGGDGLSEVLHAAGFRTTGDARDAPVAVVQGLSAAVTWAQLAEAAYALQGDDENAGSGIPWVATNTDWTLPTARGIAPGAGTFVSAVHSAVGRLPVVAGKPEVAIYEEAVSRFGASKALFLGDRLDTDILGSNRAGIDSALVLTGIDTPKLVLAAGPDSRPTYLLDDLSQLDEAYPEVRESEQGGSTVTRVGAAVIRRTGGELTILEGGERYIDLLRAGAAAIWNSGMAIYALDVPPALYQR